MTTADGSGRYLIISSAAVNAAVRDVVREAAKQGTRPLVLAALRTIMMRLQTDPLVFGEPLRRLSNLNMELRAGGVQPVLVSYAVHEARHLVFVQRIQIISDA